MLDQRKAPERCLVDGQAGAGVEARPGSTAAQGHYGHMKSYPPYVGGDDDEIDGWQATCMCGWTGVETPSVTRAHIELIDHLNGALRGS